MEYFILGIDTSNYTTSIALIDQNKKVLIDNRKILKVKEGQRGLRQSEALFQHVQNMPLLFSEMIPPNTKEKIKYVSVSTKPRPRDDSYMPVFLASKSFGMVLANVLKCEYAEFSHQENHIEAAKWSSGLEGNEPFLGVHISGGTTEILLINKQSKEYSIDIVGGSLDISAGQLIDRIGVKLGYTFPAGATIDKISIETHNFITLPTSINQAFFNLSGIETKAYQLLGKGYHSNEVAKSIMHCIGKTLGAAIKNACISTGINKILCFGGVASSRYLRSYLEKFAEVNNLSIYFGQGKYCTDNAVGTALLPLSFKEEEELK